MSLLETFSFRNVFSLHEGVHRVKECVKELKRQAQFRKFPLMKSFPQFKQLSIDGSMDRLIGWSVGRLGSRYVLRSVSLAGWSVGDIQMSDRPEVDF